MPNNNFTVENNLIDRNDLSIYEKMCSVVLARYAGRAEFSNMLNIQIIAIRMGCSVEEADQALNSLISKKLVTLEDSEHIEPEMLMVETIKVNSRVIKSEMIEVQNKPQPKAFESLESFDEESLKAPSEAPKKKGGRKKKVEEVELEADKADAKKVDSKKTEAPKELAKEPIKETIKEPTKETPTRPLVPKQVREGVQELIDEIFSIVDENINDREARIILSFANNNLDLVREKYKIAKRSQVNDKIEMLINELQKKDEPILKRSEGLLDGDDEREMPKSLQNAQIDLQSINRMVALKQSSYGKQGNKAK